MPYKDPQKERECQRKAQAKYQRTAKGMLTALRYDAKRRGTR